MSYFLINISEDGLYIDQFDSNEKLKTYLDSYCSDFPAKFLDHLPQDLYDFARGLIVIKGDVIIPKSVKIIKTFEIE